MDQTLRISELIEQYKCLNWMNLWNERTMLCTPCMLCISAIITETLLCKGFKATKRNISTAFISDIQRENKNFHFWRWYIQRYQNNSYDRYFLMEDTGVFEQFAESSLFKIKQKFCGFQIKHPVYFYVKFLQFIQEWILASIIRNSIFMFIFLIAGHKLFDIFPLHKTMI